MRLTSGYIIHLYMLLLCKTVAYYIIYYTQKLRGFFFHHLNIVRMPLATLASITSGALPSTRRAISSITCL